MTNQPTIHPMPKEPRAFPEGTLLRHAECPFFYKLLASAHWDGQGFSGGARVAHVGEDDVLTGDYHVRHCDAWFNGYADRVAREAKCDELDAELSKLRKRDPYRDNRSASSEAVIAELTEGLPRNVAARKRLVAALALEMARPVTPRFPADGRSDRALATSNGMRKP